MKIVKETDKTIVYRMNDGLLCEAEKGMTKNNIATIYYINKFLNCRRPKSWLETKQKGLMVKL